MNSDELLPKCEFDFYRDVQFVPDETPVAYPCGHPATKRDPRGPAYCANHWAVKDREWRAAQTKAARWPGLWLAELNDLLALDGQRRARWEAFYNSRAHPSTAPSRAEYEAFTDRRSRQATPPLWEPTAWPDQVDAVIADFERQMEGR